MAINNINALVDLEGLNKLENSDYVSKYYNAGLANQGQRYTNEALLEYKNFNIASLIAFRYYNITKETINPYTVIPYDKKSYLIVAQADPTQEFSLSNLSFKVCVPNALNQYNTIIDLEEEIKFDGVSNTDVKTILFSKKLYIIKKLYEKVIFDIAYDSKDKDDYNASLRDSNYVHDDIYGNAKFAYNDLQLWIPIDYKFEYVCDGINKTIIYGDHKNISVSIEPVLISNNPANIPEDPNKNGIIFVQYNRKYEKTCIYNFSFTKESEIPTVTRGFVLPFIDDDHYWWINNIPTSIVAKAEIPTNLNIILAYLHKSGNSNRFEVLSGLNGLDNKTISIDYLSSHKIWVKRHNGESFPITCQLPIINKIPNTLTNQDNETKADIEKILKNSTIILMTKLAKLLDNESDDVKKEYKDGLITTIWTYEPHVDNKGTNEYNDYNYLSIQNDDNGNRLALDFGEITNFANLINFKVDTLEQTAPDNYLNRHVIFDQILKNNKQEVTNTFAYAVLQNIKGSNYNSKYVNNFNFSLRYVNNIVGESGDNIEKVANTTDNRYFKVATSESSNLVTNSIYQRVINNRTLYYPEYIPNYNIPVFDMSEFLVKDSNVMNKQNIISFTDTGLSYYAYIGTPADSLDKSILHIGTSYVNINLGEYSLIDDINKEKFQTHNGISLDFTYSYLNSYTFVKNDLTVGENIYFEKINWNKTKIESSVIYSTQIIPKFKYVLNQDGGIYHEISIDSMGTSLNSILSKLSNPNSKYNSSKYLYLNIILSHKIKNIDYYYKYNDLLYINNLIKYLNIDDSSGLNVISNTNKIIYDTNGRAKFFVSSNNLLTDSITISASSPTKISITVQNIQDLYVGNPLDIILVKKNGTDTLIINEHQSHKIKSIWKLPDVI